MNPYFDTEEEEGEVKSFDLLGIVFKYLSYWKLFLASLVVCIVLSLLYLKTRIPIYEV